MLSWRHRSKQRKSNEAPVARCCTRLSFSFHRFLAILWRICQFRVNRTTPISLVQDGLHFPRDPTTRDARERENNLVSTLVVTAVASHPPPNQTHPLNQRRPRISFRSLFPPSFSCSSSSIPLSRDRFMNCPEVMAGPGARKLPAALSRINRRSTVGDVPQSPSRG